MPLKVYDLLVDIKRPSGYRGSLVDEGEGSFVRLWVLAENPEDAVAVLRGYLEEDGAEFQTIEELSPVEEYQAAREFYREELGFDPEDVPWEFGGRVKVLAVYEYMYDDEDEDWEAGNVQEGELEA